ncbi:MAG: Glycerol kinase, partial [uncultured Solirubrobacterales bacterium]
DPRHRPGNDRHDLPRPRRTCPGRRPCRPRAHPALPAARLGRARSRGDLGGRTGHRARGARGCRSRPQLARGDRDHQPARDRAGLGPRLRRAAGPRARMAGPPHRRALRRAARGRPRGDLPGAHRPRARLLLQRDEVGVAADRGRRRPGAGGARDHRLMARAQALRPPCHRPLERLADAGLRHPRAALRYRAVRAAVDPARGPARAAAERSRVRRDRRARRRAVRPRGRDRRRPAGGAVRPGVPFRGAREEHLRDRLVRAPEHRRRAAAARPRPALDAGLDDRRGAHRLRRRGQHLRDRRGGAVAARRARHHLRGRRDRGPRRLARVERRRLLRPCAHRPGLAALGSLRARNHRRADARQRARAPGPRRARGHRLPERRRGASDGAGLGRAPRGAPRRRRRGRERLADAVPGRRARHPGRRPRDRRDHRARRRRPGRGRGRELDRGGRARAMARGRPLRAEHVRRRARESADGLARGARAGQGRARL